MGIDETKVINGVRMYQSYNVIFGGANPKAFVCVDGMTRVELHGHIEVMRYDEKNSIRVHEVKIAVFPSSMCRLKSTHKLSFLVPPNQKMKATTLVKMSLVHVNLTVLPLVG